MPQHLFNQVNMVCFKEPLYWQSGKVEEPHDLYKYYQTIVEAAKDLVKLSSLQKDFCNLEL